MIVDLKHVSKTLSNGTLVLVLNTGATIDPEAEAMLQALHSRSIGGINSHLKTLAERGAENFMRNFYVGYGHKSIGDCGSVTIFIEGVSMLAAKAIQDWPLYSGQEASTRYIDFSKQKFIDPVGTAESGRTLESWRSFYLASLDPVKSYLKSQFPRREEEEEKVYEKAISARAFDILRGFLPAGASTNLAWHTNLRQATGHLLWLRHHPLPEVREIAGGLEEVLLLALPNSFGHKKYEATENYVNSFMDGDYYYHPENQQNFLVRERIDREQLKGYEKIIREKPPKAELPKVIAECGTVQFEYLLDFGSFRDIQRQRSVTQRMPLLSSKYGLHDWYFASLPEQERRIAEELVSRQIALIEKIDAGPEIKQYYCPMGMLVPCRMTGDLSALAYICELRAQTTVHPTLQEVALKMAGELERRFGLTLSVDRNFGRFSYQRGGHDISLKN